MSIDIRDVIADLQFEIYSDEEIINEGGNPLIPYAEKLEGNLLDIGCGQSGYILSMLNSKLNFFALDPDLKQINYLMQRVNRIAPGREVTTINRPYSSELFPELRFEYIIMANLLHLKETITDPEAFIQDVKKVMAKDCMILVCVHAGEDKENDYFRYFTLDSLKSLFPKKEFNYLYWAHHQGDPHKFNIRFGELYMGMLLDEKNIIDPVLRTFNIRNYNSKNRISEINLLVKRIN